MPISTPIKNIIFFIQENHSFDSLFARFPGANGKDAGQRCADALQKEPPVVEKWTDGTPSRYGHRLPGIMIFPYARSGYVSHNLYSHVSLLRFAETIFDLKPLTERDAKADNMLDCFDFDQPPLPPLTLTSRVCP